MVEGRRKQREVKPRQYPSENKRPTISFRVRADTFEKLKASAKEHDLSLSEEVERCVNFKFSFARDAHDEIVMRSMRAALDMAEMVAGARWFENKEAARLCHDAVKSAAALLMMGVGPGNQFDVVSESMDAGAAIGGQSVSNLIGMGTEESKQSYEATIARYRDAVRFQYSLVKLLSEGGPEGEVQDPSAQQDEPEPAGPVEDAPETAEQPAKPFRTPRPRRQIDMPDPVEVEMPKRVRRMPDQVDPREVPPVKPRKRNLKL